MTDESRGETVRWRRLLLTVGVALLLVGGAVGVAALLVASRKQPPRRTPKPEPVGVSITTLERERIQPLLRGFGKVRARRRSRIRSRVGGEVRTIHDRLEAGLVLEKGTTALTLDTESIDLDIQRLEGLLTATRAEKRQLALQKTYLEQRLAVVKKQLALDRAEERRISTLKAEGHASTKALQAAQQAVLRTEEALVGLRTTHALLSPQLDALDGRLQEREAQLERARLDRNRATVVVPYTGQIASVAVDLHDLLSAGQELFDIRDIETVEIPIPLPLDEALLLHPGLRPRGKTGTEDVATDRPVTCRVPGYETEWEGTLVRFEPVDPETQTVTAVLEVANEAGRPTLLPGLFAEAVLKAPPLEDVLSIPEEAVREQNRVFVVDSEDRLAIRNVTFGRTVGGQVLVENGLEPGDRVITSPVERPIAGTPVHVVERTGED